VKKCDQLLSPFGDDSQKTLHKFLKLKRNQKSFTMDFKTKSKNGKKLKGTFLIDIMDEFAIAIVLGQKL
jgi:hypothetical protein